MVVTIQPSEIKGSIQAPASKSSMQRGCAASLLFNGTTIIRNPGHSNDDKAALGVIQDMGAIVKKLDDGSLQITGGGVSADCDAVNCGESGLGIRMFTPIIALSDKRITINGEGSLVTRPMDFFDEVLPQLGVEIISKEGKLPLQVKGPLQPKNITIDGSLSSQFLTGLLFGYAASNAKDVTITVNNLKSKPYIDLTLTVMKQFGWEVENRNYEQFHFTGTAKPAASTITYTVEGDWSGAAFLLVTGAIAGDIVVKGLDVQSTQADRAVLQALQASGARISIQSEQIEIGPAALKAFQFDATECPDLFPPLVALAAYCKGTTVIEGVKRLTHKESNRALTLQEEFGKMGVEIELQDDLMLIKGGNGLKGAAVHSHHDHRIAMACAVAALKANGETVISEAQAINKSYPDFYEHIQALGAVVKKPVSSK
ncbi:3-phosphoshikimate 1-carboxyvinyltransferase [Niastella yeongjuensis]|uniref:3-phosphoshikimate 1-carboxyvinyltransferase n=1 Tax=Niastella yeongjuensis TaxID=354355 RepID=A0A1V9EAK3_9BACT|nr:3-phosphoshikimate 1-carboxyvinyltransferase [Niastella yeongjuensis]OQP43158.1 3-phosphoshikimate 1-carboxyvinyltransferase [Niastella yeongjuensis]SEO68747.1 3-phosphoshikimate 1-carboxyvinyltransferase [Niastella yeongjuensis]